jgi:hypothetical protein
MAPRDQGDKKPRALQRVSEALLIAAVSAAISIFASVWATNHLTSASDDRKYLLANDARTRAKDLIAEAAKSRTRHQLLLAEIVGFARASFANGDSKLAKQDYGGARELYDSALLSLERACQSTARDFCVEINLYEAARGIAANIR